jgi:molybdopterin/thiamine biosynthesis adenylyltransferase
MAFNSDFYERNIGVFSLSEQKKLSKATVAIAGVGGIGGLLAERLTRMGVGGLKITDPGRFELSNCNRQYASTQMNVGKTKVGVVAKELRRINPQLSVSRSLKGIHSQGDAEVFVKGASIIVDAMDYGLFKQSIFLQRAARRQGIFYLFSSAIAFGTIVAAFRPDGCTLEEYNGLPTDADLSTIEAIELSDDRICSTLPDYIKKTGMKKKYLKMVRGEIPVSTNSIGVGLSSIVSANEVVKIILKRKSIITAPSYIHVDLMEPKYQIFSPKG